MQETLLASSEIHGGTKENQQPAINGLFITLNRCASIETCKNFILGSKKIGSASASIHKQDVSKFEESEQNVNRSFSMLYAGGILNKRKYAQTRSSLRTYAIGTTTENGYLQGRRLSLSGVYP